MIAALVAAVAVAATPQASFSFGRAGGNIVPMTASIAADGRVTVDGARSGRISPARMRALVRLVKTQGFFLLPRTIACKGTLPDIAGLYVRAHVASRTHTVSVHGGCSPRFARVYGALVSAAHADR